MNRLIVVIVVMLFAMDLFTLGVMEKWKRRPAPPDLSGRVTALEKELAQAQADIGELKQEMQLVERRGQPPD